MPPATPKASGVLRAAGCEVAMIQADHHCSRVLNLRSDAGRRGPAMEALFGLYDALEASAQEGLAAPPDGADAAAVAAAGVQLLEELRTRFARLVLAPAIPC